MKKSISHLARQGMEKEGMDRYVMILEPIHLICEDDIMNGSFLTENLV